MSLKALGLNHIRAITRFPRRSCITTAPTCAISISNNTKHNSTCTLVYQAMIAGSLWTGVIDARLNTLIGRSIISTPVISTSASIRYMDLWTSNAAYSGSVRLMEKSRPWPKE